MSNISHSGYLFKRSNHPHRNADELQDRRKRPYGMDLTINAPELPVISGMFDTSTVGPTDGKFQVISDGPYPHHINNSTIAVTPSPNNTSTTETTESVEPIKLNQQSTFSPHRPDQTKSAAKNPLQIGIEIGAAFFGIKIEKDRKSNDENIIHRLGRENSSSIDTNMSEENDAINAGKKIQPRILSTTIDPKWSSQSEMMSSTTATTTAKRPIPTNTGSLSYQGHSHSSLHDAINRQQSAPTILSESPYSSEFFNFNSSTSGNTSEDTNIPQDFYDPEDGHLWRAKFCVLEDGILYFYRNANDGNCAEAAAERQKSKNTQFEEDHNGKNDYNSSSYHDNFVQNDCRGDRASNPLSAVISKVESRRSASPLPGRSIHSRRKSSAKDLSKSPMVRPGLHPLATSDLPRSEGDSCIWEKRVFMDCVGGVRTAEQQYGRNSFELQAMDDDESDVNFIDTLVLKGQNSAEMKEWIFQFHRSLASFMRNFIDVVGSSSNGGTVSESYNPSTMLLSSRSSRHLSSSSLIESGSLPQSSSEKHLQRLISTSPSLQQTLSHGHGRISLKRRMDIKRTRSESASLSSTPDGDMEYMHHPFAFREPSPNNIQLSQESSSPPVRVLIPPQAQNFIPAFKGNFESMAMGTTIQSGTTIPSVELGQRNPDFQNIESKSSEIHRPKPSVSSGKYIPPHIRNKAKYIPPHLRHKQDQGSLDCNDATTILPSERKSFINEEETQEEFLSFLIDTPDRLDIINPSTSGFIRGGCADPLLVQGSILDQVYIPKKASQLRKTAAEAFGSYGGGFSIHSKKTTSSLRWEIGAISECGVRESNEDAYLIANDLLNAFESSSYGTPPQTAWTEELSDHTVGLFGIFDGHCGNQGARFAVEHLGRFIHDELRLKGFGGANDGINYDASMMSPVKIESILREAMVKLDVAFCNLCQEEGREWESGSTALVAMLANENLVIASLGDCRGFLCRFVDDTESCVSDDCWEQLEIDNSGESSSENEPLQRCFWREVTTVHSPSADKERERIENANGWITTETEIPIGQLRRMDFHDEDVIGILKRCLHHRSNSTSLNESERSTKECKAAPQRIIHISRVCGELAVSRALGDRDFKADFNCAPGQRSNSNDFETKEDSSSYDNMPWESPLFLPYPENHNRQFQGDLVTNTPDFHQIRLGTKGVSDEFLLLACDGLWDVMDADDAIRVVRDLLFRKKVTAKKAAARLAELAIHLGSSDNITVLLLRLFPREYVE